VGDGPPDKAQPEAGEPVAGNDEGSEQPQAPEPAYEEPMDEPTAEAQPEGGEPGSGGVSEEAPQEHEAGQSEPTGEADAQPETDDAGVADESPEEPDAVGEPVPADPAAPEETAIASVVAAIRTNDGRWEPGSRESFGEVAWRPNLRRADPPAVLHVHLAERLRPYIVDRMRSAFEAGSEVHIALPLGVLYDEETLSILLGLDAQVHVIDGEEQVSPIESLLTCLASRGIHVSPSARKELARAALELCAADGTTYQRGRRYEAVICFLLSQIEDFDVVEHNLRTDTEELDAVVQQRATQGRAWATLGAPFILVEAKNWATAVPQKEVSVFRVKLEGRRGGVRIGLMFGASGFTSDALDHELRFASDELTIAFVGPDQLRDWAEADDPEDFLERLVRRAILR
jgi:hypothetical protein